jgi:hypothetical protein
VKLTWAGWAANASELKAVATIVAKEITSEKLLFMQKTHP